MTLGEVVQAAAAFVIVQGALNWFVDNYQRLADLLSSVNRVSSLLVALDKLEHAAGCTDGHLAPHRAHFHGSRQLCTTTGWRHKNAEYLAWNGRSAPLPPPIGGPVHQRGTPAKAVVFKQIRRKEVCQAIRPQHRPVPAARPG